MSWKLAPSLDHLFDQLNRAAPGRSRKSDGSIGDQAHQNRKSDHNPDSGGLVRAIDVTNDSGGGLSAETLAEALRASQDSRIKYVIWNRRIFSSSGKSTRPAWNWGKYNGNNPHTRHIHISIKSGVEAQADTSDWDLRGLSGGGSFSTSSGSAAPASTAVSVSGMPEIHLKNADSSPYRGPGSKQLQGLLLAAGHGPDGMIGEDNMPDGECGGLTKSALGEFQVSSGTGRRDGTADYSVGARTWGALLGLSERLGQGRPSSSNGRPSPTAGGNVTFSEPFGPGATGPQVRALQSKLRSYGYTVDTNGTFGDRTERAIKNFQKANGRDQSGSVDASLWRLLDLP